MPDYGRGSRVRFLSDSARKSCSGYAAKLARKLELECETVMKALFGLAADFLLQARRTLHAFEFRLGGDVEPSPARLKIPPSCLLLASTPSFPFCLETSPIALK